MTPKSAEARCVCDDAQGAWSYCEVPGHNGEPVDSEGKPMTLAKALAISRELSLSSGKADEALRAKCNWEHMSRPAVIMEWGDPRTWNRTDE